MTMDSAPKLPPKPMREQAKVLFPYEAQNEDELTIREGDIINVLSKEIEDQGWFRGELNGQVGVFPDNFVELIKVPDILDQLPPRPKGPATIAAAPASSPPVSSSPIGVGIGSKGPNGIKMDSNKSEPSGGGSVKNILSALKTKQSTGPGKPVGTKPVISGSVPSSSSKPDLMPYDPATSSTSSHNTSSVIPGPDGTGDDGAPGNATSPSTTSTSANHHSFPSSGATNGFTAMNPDPTAKLSHPTANRPKGPSNRRPPSYISVPSNNNNNNNVSNGNGVKLDKENGGDNDSANGFNSSGNKVVSPLASATGPNKTSPSPVGKEDPPWMVELRRKQEAQEAKKAGSTVSHPHGLGDRSQSLDESSGPQVPERNSSSKVAGVAANLAKASLNPHRASGDFSSRFAGGVDSTSNAPPSVSILKPVKPNKPTIGSTNTTNTSAASTMMNPPVTMAKPSLVMRGMSSTSTGSTSSSGSAVTPTAASRSVEPTVPFTREVIPPSSLPVTSSSSDGKPPAPTTAPPATTASSLSSSSTSSPVSHVASGHAMPLDGTHPVIMELKREMRETMVPRKEFDELTKQVMELKENLENQKLTNGNIVKELINDLASERKKLAILQIEIDRLTKLTTTV